MFVIAYKCNGVINTIGYFVMFADTEYRYIIVLRFFPFVSHIQNYVS